MSRRILELSKNGEELVDFLFTMMRDAKADEKCRIHCAEILLERGLGKTPQSIDLNTEAALTEDEYNAEIAEIVREHLAQMTPDEKLRLLANPAPSVTIQ